jgi:MoaA/NifB/PqqE/SkfB family radical SAM enzyme
MKKSIGIEVKVTNRCNQRCFHCMNNDSANSGEDLDSVQFTEKLNQWANAQVHSDYRIKEIRMTGGEPLLNLHTVTGIAHTCRSLGIDTGINTNATLLDKPTAQQLKESGLKIVKASFDTIDENTFRQMRGKRASWARTLAGIRTAIEGGFRVILRLTLCSYNRKQLLSCYYMARDLGVEKLQIKPLISTGRANFSEAFLTRAEVRQALCELSTVVRGPFAQPEILCWPSEDSGSLPCKGCGSLDKIYVSPNFDVFTCNYIVGTDGIGNLIKDTLETIFYRRKFESPQNDGRQFIIRGCPQVKYFRFPT